MKKRANFQTRTLSVTSGKGGVGKTTLVSNLAQSLADTGHRVLILDGDMGLSNVEIFFNVRPKGTLLDLLQSDREVGDIVTPLAANVDLISSGSGFAELNRLNRHERKALVDAVLDLEYRYDYLIVDTAPGLGDNVLYLNSAVDTVCLVITSDPASITDSYALMKVLNHEYKRNHFSIICNQVRDETDGLSLYSRFADVSSRFLNVGLDYLGAVPADASLKRATLNQRLILRQDPTATSSIALRQLAKQIERSLEQNSTFGRSTLFWEQVMGVA